jgi:hypothetical protein
MMLWRFQHCCMSTSNLEPPVEVTTYGINAPTVVKRDGDTFDDDCAPLSFM